MGKVLTEVRSPQRSLIPDIEDWERHELPFLRGIAYKAKKQPNYRFRDMSQEVNKTLLRNSFRKLNKKAASGVDRVTYFDYSPILANIYLHHAVDEWFEKEVKSHCKGEEVICRYADDFVCAFQYAEDAERFYRVLPKRLKKFNLEVAEEKTNKLRFSRFQPGLKNRFSFLSF
ncbi:MAG: reverse transcriptase domain-containing protein [Sedimenticola sp.]